MREKLIVWTIAFLLPIAIIAGNIDVGSTGPSGQGDLVYKARATGVTNLAMGTGGVYNLTIDPRYPISGTVTKQTGAVTATAVVTPQAPTTVTPTITLTPETGAITATATPTLQAPGAQTPTITVTIQATTIYDATGAACTNAAGEVVGVVTGATATCSALPNFPTNLTIAVSVVGGGAVWTNATAACSALPDFATNATAAITVTGGGAVVTNVSMTVP
jgi:hypothetical protein